MSSYAIDDGARLLLFDPLSVPDELLELAADREPVVVLTAPWHERDTQSLVERLGVPVFVPPPDTADDLVRKYGITPEQAGGGSPDVAWLLAGDGGEAHLYAAGDRLPIGIEAFPGREHNDLVLWIESRRAVVAGDALVDSRAGRRRTAAAARAAGRGRAPGARSTDRPCCARARALLTADVHHVACASVRKCSLTTASGRTMRGWRSGLQRQEAFWQALGRSPESERLLRLGPFSLPAGLCGSSSARLVGRVTKTWV